MGVVASMRILRYVLLAVFGFGFSFAACEFASLGDWGMLSLSASVWAGVFYLIVRE